MGFKEVVEVVKNETMEVVEITKLRAKISKEKSTIKSAYVKIGEKIAEKYPDGGAGEEIDALIAEVAASKAKIEELNDEISRTKMED